jgi:pentatricopeptide repeat protein
LQDALSRFKNVRRAGRHPRYNTYAKLITAAAKTKQADLIHEILGMAQSDVPYLPEFPTVKAGWIPILDAMVAACLTVGDRQLAAKYHQDLLDMGASPSANTFGIYITTLEGTFDEATEAVKIFQRALSEGVEPGVFLYNAVIGKLGKARRIDDCLFYFGDMQSRNIRPSSVTYGTLVNALCRTSEERFAEEMFDEMESMPNYRPRAAPYNCIIQYFLNTKRDRSKVLAYFERMKARNIKPTSHTYKLLIEAHATLEPINLGAAEAILDDIKSSGMQPEAVHYGSLIHAKGCVMHDMAAARATFDSVLSDSTIRPTDALYQNLFEAMVANHQVSDTSKVLEDMAARNVPLTPYIANTLIHGWAAEGNVEKAKSIYNSLGVSKREPSTYEAMTRAYLSAEDHQNASKVVQEMLRKGYPSAVAEKILLLIGGSTA